MRRKRRETVVLVAAIALIVVCCSGCGSQSGATGTQAGALLGMTTGAVTGYAALRTRKEGDGAWGVVLEAEEAGGPGTSIEVHVICEGGDYVVC